MKNIESFYPLSPMQQGLLYHSLRDAEPETYLEQLTCTINGQLDAAVLQQAWQLIIDRHSVLRVAFLWDGVDQPVQIAHRKVRLPWQEHDWRSLPQDLQMAKLDDFLRADRARGFNLTQVPAMRCALIRIVDDSYQFIWSHHHILLDGWSIPLLLRELSELYDALSHSRQPRLNDSRPYRDYVAWLRQQDQTLAESYWRKLLKSFTSPTILDIDHLPSSAPQQRQEHLEQQVSLSVETTLALQALARQHELTLNSLVQGA